MAIILEELSLPYKIEEVPAEGLKKEPFTTINPNGRVPAIKDPNTGIVLWESAAIILYLVETYDKEGKISYDTVREKHQLNQWLAFQVSGQGPYWGQAVWFHLYHPDKVPSVLERYLKEIERTVGVLDSWLQKHEWLVGDKLRFADLSFVPYSSLQLNVPWMHQGGDVFEGGKYPAYQAWLKKLMARESVKAANK